MIWEILSGGATLSVTSNKVTEETISLCPETNPTPILLQRKDNQAFQRGFEKGITPLFATERKSLLRPLSLWNRKITPVATEKQKCQKGLYGLGVALYYATPLWNAEKLLLTGVGGFG